MSNNEDIPVVTEQPGSEFYVGSHILLPIAVKAGLPIDQFNFLIGQLFAICAGIILRKTINASKENASSRHIAELIIGAALAYFCFGYQIIHLFVQGTMCYLVIHFCPRKHFHTIGFVIILGFLVVLHCYRIYYSYMFWQLDITGPVMIATQKLTSLLFSIHDGTVKKPEELNPDQKEQAIHEIPSMLEFYSYLFSFHMILVGPVGFYHDYIAFIEGANKRDGQVLENMPGELWLKKIIVSLVCAYVMFQLSPRFPHTDFTGKNFMEYNAFIKMLYVVTSLTLMRGQYYFAWGLGELVNNAAGMGFSGFDDKNQPKWDLMSNVDIWAVEFGTTLRSNISGWNTTTTVWLRRVVYDRVGPAWNVWATYAVTSLWHGVYPGYYIAFFSTALFTLSARSVRRNIRPHFQVNAVTAFIYDCITFVFTRLCNGYMVIPFVTLEFIPSIKIYLSMYCWLHVLAFIGLTCLPGKKTERQKRE